MKKILWVVPSKEYMEKPPVQRKLKLLKGLDGLDVEVKTADQIKDGQDYSKIYIDEIIRKETHE